MATLKKKNTVEEVPTMEVTDTTETTEEQSYMNEEEKEVLTSDGEQYIDDSTKVSSDKMNKVLNLLQDTYNLRGKGFELIGYADKGNKIVATLANTDYEAQFTIKSSEVIMMLGMDM